MAQPQQQQSLEIYSIAFRIGSAPSQKHNIQLSDVVISTPNGGRGGVFQYDFGKTIQNYKFQDTGFLNQPPLPVLSAVTTLKGKYAIKGHQLIDEVDKNIEKIKKKSAYRQPAQASDRLYKSNIIHSSSCCDNIYSNNTASLIACAKRGEEDNNPTIHYNLITSKKDVLCFEIEAASLINHFPCLIIRGIYDYSNSHKNKEWQGFAAMMAAAYAKDLLYHIALDTVEAEKPIPNSKRAQFVVPFRRDSDFVNRPDIWSWTETRYAGSEICFALMGLSGFSNFSSVEESGGHNDGDLEDYDNGDLEDDLEVLQGYSLVAMTVRSGFCEMHPL
ncbi:hypothetical protein CGCSCA4_v002369 [Colletotrichum siamense]|uniref:Nucleoside phosphorylase domain-containing protein n=1 Tax=Colletotrichum siamense TaxID=690259 RepID=A0A9P5F246_COLSI|nr:hypothetical protein CGCSCA4_v002369 [Colletotrichum siamense]KAF4864081.1 hypothetical protein CGCSCA2_v002504 [Colletotrichum siamense]